MSTVISCSESGTSSGQKLPPIPPKIPTPRDTFTTLWAEALRKFQQSADVRSTRWDSLLHRMCSCRNEEDVCVVLDEIMQNLEHFRVGDPKWNNIRHKYLKPVIRTLLLFNDAIAETAAYFPLIPGGKAIFVAIGVLLEASNGIAERCDALIGLLEELNSFLGSLRIRLTTTTFSLGPDSTTIAITILAHLLDVLLIATKLFSPSKWRMRLAFYRKALTRDETLRAALDRLTKLRDLEEKAIVAETRAAVSDLQDLIKPVLSEIELLKRELQRMSKAQQQHCTGNDVSRLLDKLRRVEAADFDAQNSNGCLEGTRVEILEGLSDWSRDPLAPQIYWLNGMAGTGKSAIARSFCLDLREANLLGGSFFCSRRASAAEADVRRIIPTLAVSMALRDTHCTMALLAELDVNTFSRHWKLDLQIERLLVKPFSGIESKGHPLPVLVVDALDECSDMNLTHDLIMKLVLAARKLPVKLFLTSRPESHIRQHLECLDSSLGQVLRLHDVEKDIVGGDIGRYLRHGLQSMRSRSTQPDWPMDSDITTLTHRSGKLFIYASTALRYIRKDPIGRLSKLTGTRVTAGRALFQCLDDIYGMVLSGAMDPDEYDVDEIDLTRRMTAVTVSLYEPMKVMALARLLNIPAHRVRKSLDRVHAVIYVPTHDHVGYLSTFHASFSDFLNTPERAPDYMSTYMCERHVHLAAACLSVLRSDALCFNVTRIDTSYRSDTTQKHEIDDALHYACLYWSDHVCASPRGELERLLAMLEVFFVGPKFLYWLEALSVLDSPRRAHDMLEDIQQLFSYPLLSRHGQLEIFISDGMHFINHSEPILQKSLSHIYLSALAFCPPASAVYRHCISYFPNLARLRRNEPLNPISASSQTATFSPDGRQIIVGFDTGEVGIWDACTGELVLRGSPRGLGDPSQISSLAVSPSVHRNVIVCHVDTVDTWDMEKSTPVKTISTGGSTSSFALSPDGRRIAVALKDEISTRPGSRSGLEPASSHAVELWDLDTGTQSCPSLTSYEGIIHTMAFSPNSHHLVSGSVRGAVTLWDAQTGSLVHRNRPLSGISQSTLSVAFSPNGLQFMACISSGRVMIWCTTTGVRLFMHEWVSCCPHWVPSPNGPSPKASIMSSSKARITFNCRECDTYLPECDHLTSSRFALDTCRLATIGPRHKVCLWNLQTSSPAYAALHDSGLPRFVNISPDSRQLVTYAARDRSIRLWHTDVGLANDTRRQCTFGPDLSCMIQNYAYGSPSPAVTDSLPRSSPSPIFRLREDGWIEDVACKPRRLLLWIPEDMRKSLYLPPMSLIISPAETWSLDLSRFVHGKRWTECYRGETTV
ncbi:hypothetical protein PENSPDRAFT_760435 [Peniophora sp. CONT]|nr:hypothetical protein PENSPDRAFT_760435 [Peniophora sp. CONT]